MYIFRWKLHLNPRRHWSFSQPWQQAPFSCRTSVSSLVAYLKKGAENHFQLVRMFYRWITFNVRWTSYKHFKCIYNKCIIHFHTSLLFSWAFHMIVLSIFVGISNASTQYMQYSAGGMLPKTLVPLNPRAWRSLQRAVLTFCLIPSMP